MSLRLMIVPLAILVLLAACASPTPTPIPTAAPTAAPAAQTDLAAIKTYLLAKSAALKTHTAALTGASNRYFDLAQGANFDYAALWQSKPADVTTALLDGRAAWKLASPTYEQMEGIVAGTPSLEEFDVILDAGASAKESPDDAVPFDLVLEDGRTLKQPGNLFGVTESALYGTEPEYTIQNVAADLDGNGTLDLGDALPNAYVLKAGAALLEKYANDLDAAAQAWTPTESDAFSALVVMVPTMGEYFDSWKNSRFVAGDASTQRDFVAISRLADIQDILSSLQVVYASVKPMVRTVDATQAEQLEKQLSDLKAFVAQVYAQEQNGKQFTAEEAETLGTETQNRATAIAGEIAQVAEKLNVKIVE
jgi:hypothetical protein